MTPDQVEALFTRDAGDYLFARWQRAIAPVIFGVTEETLPVLKGAIQAVAALANHPVEETDPELGANLMVFFIKEWRELSDTPRLDDLIPNLAPLVETLTQQDANQYRIFRFEKNGAIKAAFVFLRMDEHLSVVPAETLALSQMVQTILLWSDMAFRDASPLAMVPNGTTVLKPEIGALIRAAYDPIMPVMSQDKSHALRLAARIGQSQ